MKARQQEFKQRQSIHVVLCLLWALLGAGDPVKEQTKMPEHHLACLPLPHFTPNWSNSRHKEHGEVAQGVWRAA